jgi:hypothetical protein
VAVKAAIAVAPALDEMAVFVALFATGGLLLTGMVTVAGADTPPLLSVTIKVKVSLPVNVPVGS